MMQRKDGPKMEALIWIGVALVVLGILGLIYCIVVAARARSAGLEGEAMEARLRKLVAFNLGSLALSGLGLMLVVVGIFLS